MLISPFSTQRALPTPPIVWTKTASTSINGVVLNNLKTWIKRPLEDTFWDTEAQALVTVAFRALERYIGNFSFAPSTWVGTMPYIRAQEMIWRRPFLGVDKVEIVEPDTGSIVTVDPATYQAAPITQMCGQLWADEGGWPDTAIRQDAVRVTVKTGWPLDSSDPPAPILPEDLMHAILMTVASLDMHRGEEGTDGGHLASTVYGQTHSSGPNVIPPGVQALVAPFHVAGLWLA